MRASTRRSVRFCSSVCCISLRTPSILSRHGPGISRWRSNPHRFPLCCPLHCHHTAAERTAHTHASLSRAAPALHSRPTADPPRPAPGSGESGKTTIVKQMKIIHQNGFTREELLSYRSTIYKNLVDSAQAVVLQMRKMGADCGVPENRRHAEEILQVQVGSSSTFVLPQEIADAIHAVWQDPIIPSIMDLHSSDFYLMDSAS